MKSLILALASGMRFVIIVVGDYNRYFLKK